MKYIDSNVFNWEKLNDLIPAVIQHAYTGDVLMLCHMDKQALEITQVTNKLALFSQSMQRLWRKGENSGNTMDVVSITASLDGDSMLVQVIPSGLASFSNYNSYFQPPVSTKIGLLADFISLLQSNESAPPLSNETSALLESDIAQCARLTGYLATDTIIAAVQENHEILVEKTAGLIFHLLVLLQVAKVSFYEVIDFLCSKYN